MNAARNQRRDAFVGTDRQGGAKLPQILGMFAAGRKPAKQFDRWCIENLVTHWFCHLPSWDGFAYDAVYKGCPSFAAGRQQTAPGLAEKQ